MNAMEKIEVDNKDRPIEDIILQRAQVFVDPYQEADQQLAAERAAELERIEQEAKRQKRTDRAETSNISKIYRSGAGKYIKTSGGVGSKDSLK